MAPARTAPALLLAVLAVAAVRSARASAGDQDPAYAECVEVCRQSYTDEKAHAMPMTLRVLQWSWTDDCRYECMHRIVAERVARGEEIQQYHGKWPFVRVAGVQEPASVLFSLANLAGYVVGFPAYWAVVRRDDFFSTMWLGYCACGINAWLWSATFHTRDMLLTERMDYFSAGLLNFAGAYCAAVRVFEIRSRPLRVALGLVVASLYAAHVGYLSFVMFDYGWNMLVNIVVSVIAGVLWIGWAVVRRAPHAWWAIATVVTLSAAMSLELLDFPPLWWALDAHALWHAATVPTMLLWYRFLRADALARRNKFD